MCTSTTASYEKYGQRGTKASKAAAELTATNGGREEQEIQFPWGTLRFHVNFSNKKTLDKKISREVARFDKNFPSFGGNHGHDRNQRATIVSNQRSSKWQISSTTDLPP